MLNPELCKDVPGFRTSNDGSTYAAGVFGEALDVGEDAGDSARVPGIIQALVVDVHARGGVRRDWSGNCKSTGES